MITITSILSQEKPCIMCGKARRVASVIVDGKGETHLCEKHVWAVAEMQTQMSDTNGSLQSLEANNLLTHPKRSPHENLHA